MQPPVIEKNPSGPGVSAADNVDLQPSMLSIFPGLFKKTLRFGLVSVFTTIIDYLVLALILLFLPNGKPLAIASGYVTGVVVHFFIARRFVFGATRHTIGTEFLYVFLIGLTGLALTEAIVLPLNGLLGMNVFLAKAIAIATVFCWNFGARRFLIYNHRTAS